MKVAMRERYGGPEVVRLEEVEKPVPKDDQVLVKVFAASLNVADWYDMKGPPSFLRLISGGGILKPKNKRLGSDVAGQVEAVGSGVTHFRPGDEVFGFAGGSLAEYVCTREKNLVLKPASVSFDEGGAIGIAAITALQGLRDKGKVQRGQKVLINGAAGGVGTYAVQIAKSLGAEVTAVCSTQHLDQARTIGADHVVDYTKEDVTRSGQLYDLVLAVNGYHSLFSYRRILTPKGAYIMVGSNKLIRALLQTVILGGLVSRREGKRTGFFIANLNNDDLVFLKGLMEEGKMRPVIDKRYPLSEVSEAFRYLGQKHAGGKVVVTMGRNGN